MKTFRKIFKNKLIQIASFLLVLLVFTRLAISAYNTLYHLPLKFPDQEVWADNQIATEAKVLLAKRWNTNATNILILSLWKSGTGTTINLLNKVTMSDAILFLPIGNSINPIPTHPHYKEVAKNSVTYFSASFGTLYLTTEYIPKTDKDMVIIKNYYSNKYPWLPTPTYKTIIKSDLKYGWFIIGSHAYSVTMGLPIGFFPLIVD